MRVKSRSALAHAVGGLADARDLRRKTLELLQVAARAEQEHAAVPVVVAGIDELRRPLRVGLFDETRDAKQPPRSRRPALDVAVAGLGRRGHDAEGHQLPRLGGARSAVRTAC